MISYFQIYAFHPDLNLDNIVVFCSFQQIEDEIYNLNPFSQDQAKCFDKVTFQQLKDFATNVLNKVTSITTYNNIYVIIGKAFDRA